MEGKEVIVKKVKKGGHEGHHGGAWKVAYADFVTAMMAFFLLMWLVTAMKQKDLAGIAVYFREYDVTKGEQDIKKKIDAAVQKIELVNQGNAQVSTPQQVQLVDVDSQKGEAIMQALRSDIQIRLAQVADQILIDVYEGAVRIQLVDKDGTPLFPAGSAQLTPVAKQILAVLAEKVIQSGVKIAIEGHTDAHGS
jgi:chemotaxis protein MotB